jgi:hypothetical protein
VSRTGAEVDPGLSRAEQKRRGVMWGQEVGRRRDSDGETGIPVTSTKAKPWSMDANLAQENFTNICACDLGIGRIDIVENRPGLKSRGCYDVSHFEFRINVLCMISRQIKAL